MTPGYRIASPLGGIVLRVEDDLLTGLFFVGQKYFPALSITSAQQFMPPVARQAQTQLDEFFAGERRVFTVPLHLRGTAFQRLVWKELSKIPYGVTVSYGAMAQRMGLTSGAARAVGSANGKNPVSLIVPCHRVIASTGDLTGYAGGIDRKQALLALEKGAHMDLFTEA
ncbi:cysteine methyltransferase [Caballeronia mineralivorans PML1(12)]|uniref:Methylated-DNA--protein-cysteine methyltransferase n=1 Tax=Caballeronia mineralivorans PML1(12) TaxID=908627 RepID=A0A0J1CU59_9BURK|nr:methylated-DNA--[protein]-cysteine S-methyltransferase [Caballeronia mineralivorans]KLU24127.1 cysteine methyltransferase [Caballeronia mineralivorans PML1(12)]